MKFFFILAFIYISYVDGGYLIKNGLRKELISFIALMAIATFLGVGSLFKIPTPIEWLARLF